MLTLIDAGKFVSDGSVKNLDLPAGADFMETLNYTQSITTQATGRSCRTEWQKGMPQGDGLSWKKADNTDVMNLVDLDGLGFTYYDSFPVPGPAVTGTAITAASPAVVTSVAHGYSNGDRIRLYGTTGMLQIAGMDFTISSVSADAYTLAYLPAAGFAAAATALVARKLPKEDIVNPAVRGITAITKAAQAVVTFSVTHNYIVGQKLKLRVPSEFGMIQMDQLEGKIVAINTTNNTVTLDIDSSGFTTFAFPTSASVPVSLPNAAPAGSEGIYGDHQAYKSGYFVPKMQLAAGAQAPAGSSGDVIYYRAYRSERYVE